MKQKALLFLGFLFISGFCFAQEQDLKPLVPEWVEKDVKGVKFVMGLTPVEGRKIADVEKLFEAFPNKHAAWSDKSALGFGAERVTLNMGLGYTKVYIDYLVFKDRIVHYKIGADVSTEDWPRQGKAVIQAWKDGGGPDFKLQETEHRYEKDFPEVWKAYYDEVDRELGAMKALDVPKDLAPHYRLLTDPFENSDISVVACSEGKPAIDALEDAKRIDLIENVLRGYNPGGRIYAAISLLRMQRTGRRLTIETKQAIAKVVNSEAAVSTCWGDTGTMGLRARDVVPEYVKSKEWYLLRKKG